MDRFYLEAIVTLSAYLEYMKLDPQETELMGKWIVENGQTRADPICERIKWLTAHHLIKMSISKQWGAWETLFQDPDDGRYWEQMYPQSERHGGGPPTLKHLSREQAKAKYGSDIE